jgi:UDP-N-acetyl-D-galactosamine dehydrogenase
MPFDIKNLRIGIVGLGYVGLPLAVEFGKKYPTIGFDIKADRIAELETGVDSTLECSSEELGEATQLSFGSEVEALKDCNFYIVTVPTPIGDGNRPLLTPLRAASKTIGNVLVEGDVQVFWCATDWVHTNGSVHESRGTLIRLGEVAK